MNFCWSSAMHATNVMHLLLVLQVYNCIFLIFAGKLYLIWQLETPSLRVDIQNAITRFLIIIIRNLCVLRCPRWPLSIEL